MFIHPQEISQIQAHITKTPKPNLINTLLRSLTLSKTPEKVLPIYNLLLLSSLQNHFIFKFALKACTFLPSPLIQKGHEIHSTALKSGHKSDIFVQTSLLTFYSADLDINSCRTVFSEILSPNVASWTSLISACAKNGFPGESLLAFASMDVEPNEMTLVSVLSSCSRLKDCALGKILHGICFRRFGGHGSNVILDNALLNVYLDCGSFDSAAQLFDVMPQRDVVSATIMISGFAHRYGRYEEGIALFVELVGGGEILANELIVACVLGACASAGILKFGKWVHCYSLRNNIDVDGIVGNALIHMYSKCGAIGTALLIFDELICKDLVSWCTIMRGLGTNGKPKHAIKLFALMLCYGVQPDNIAFLAVMSACCHAGLIEEGLMFFRAMYSAYGIFPGKEHYTCMIDTFGRASCLKEAEDFFIGMPMEPDKCVWGALLSACKVHGVDEVVYKRIQKRVLYAEMSLGGGTYALLSNLLAKDERWDESNKVRKQLNAKKSKVTGYSWTELA